MASHRGSSISARSTSRRTHGGAADCSTRSSRIRPVSRRISYSRWHTLADGQQTVSEPARNASAGRKSVLISKIAHSPGRHSQCTTQGYLLGFVSDGNLGIGPGTLTSPTSRRRSHTSSQASPSTSSSSRATSSSPADGSSSSSRQ
jgi:hypothetical protein